MTDMDERLEQLDQQVRAEVDRRIRNLMMECMTYMYNVLKSHEIDLYVDGLNAFAERLDVQLSPAALEVFRKVEEDPEMGEKFESLRRLIKTKTQANFIAARGADEKLERLEEQVKGEINRRIRELMGQYRARAQEILTEDELDVFTEHLGALISDPNVKLTPYAETVFGKLDADKQANDIFRQMYGYIQTIAKAAAIENNSEKK